LAATQRKQDICRARSSPSTRQIAENFRVKFFGELHSVQNKRQSLLHTLIRISISPHLIHEQDYACCQVLKGESRSTYPSVLPAIEGLAAIA
jgi:hypothetical protein